MSLPPLERPSDGRCMMTIDVEEWYEPLRHRGIAGWEAHRLDPLPALERILAVLKESGHGATFFVVGTFAREHPQAVKLIAAHGFEIGSHADVHETLRARTPRQLEDGLRDALARLADLSGRPVRGFRAPFFSFVPWLPDSLKRCGLAYDSSIVPTAAAVHGQPTREKEPYRLQNGLVEVPISVRFGLPVAGLTYLKLLPFAVVRRLIRPPYLLYLHPREIDERIPVLALPPHLKYLLYFRLKASFGLLQRILRLQRFVSVADYLEAHGPA